MESTTPLTHIAEYYSVRTDDLTEVAAAPVFLRPAFFELQRAHTDRAFYFRLVSDACEQTLAVAPVFHVGNGRYATPLRGSFGGFFFAPRRVSFDVAEAFVREVEARLLDGGMREWVITLPPAAYAAEASVLANIFWRLGYHVQRHDLNYALPITAVDIADGFNRGNRKNLRRAQRSGWRVRKLDATQLKAAYDLIVANRTHRGFSVTMTWDDLWETHEKLAGVISAFGVFDGDSLIASSICLAVSTEIFYVFYWGQLPGVDNPSPLPFLAQALYEYGRENGFQLLDLGTSTDDGEPNYGLIRFKRSLGFQESLKLRFAKRFDAVAKEAES